VAIAVAGQIPATSQQLLQQLRTPTARQQATPWVPVPREAVIPRVRTVRSAPGVTLLFAFPPLLVSHRELLLHLWGAQLQRACAACPGWAQTAALQWHVMGSTHMLEVTLTTATGVHMSSENLGRDATAKLGGYRPSLAMVAAAQTMLASRAAVAHSNLAEHTAAYLEVRPKESAEQVHAILDALSRYLAEPRTTILRNK
jgi:hypothetical protein